MKKDHLMAALTITPGQTRIGWIGTGVMGNSMCGHLLKAGFAATIYSRTKEKSQALLDQGASWAASAKEVVLFEGPLAPGPHEVRVRLSYEGDGKGVFSYLEAYAFKVKGARVITVDSATTTRVVVTGFDKGDATAEWSDRPGLRIDVARDVVTAAR